MQSDRVLTNFWAGNFPLALESRERDSGDNGVSAYFGGGGVASLVPTREIEAAASNDFESTRLVGRVIQFEYVCVAPKIRPCFADDSHRRSRNRSSRPDLHPARQFFFAADPSDSSLYHPSPPLKRRSPRIYNDGTKGEARGKNARTCAKFMQMYAGNILNK